MRCFVFFKQVIKGIDILKEFFYGVVKEIRNGLFDFIGVYVR